MKTFFITNCRKAIVASSKLIILFIASLMVTVVFAQNSKLIALSSPDKATAFQVQIGQNGQPEYRISFNNKTIINWSSIGLETSDVVLADRKKLEAIDARKVNKKFEWYFGEADSIDNSYKVLTLLVASGKSSYKIIVRAYNGSVAFRYLLPSKGSTLKSIHKENTQFNFVSPFTLYQYNHESVFTPTLIDTFNTTSDLPTTLVTNNKQYYISLGEAENLNYTKAELVKNGDNGLAISFTKNEQVSYQANYETPWRTISIATSAIGLHQFSSLNLKLCKGAFAKPAATVKAGKLIRAGLTTQAGINCIDFAAKNNFQYIMYDAGWYGQEFRSTSDPTMVIPAIDMPKVIAYGKEKGIGVILYVNYVGLKAKLDIILPLYKSWGVAGMKFGFVDGFTQQGLTWLSDAISKVNAYGFVLNIHDNYKPTGLSRTWPALLTQEGIRGDENSPDAFHTTTLPFTRYLAGAADFTYCYPNPKKSFSKNLKVSKAQQLALTVVYYSPLQAIFWYGDPRDYTHESEIEFFKYVPTVWNETKYLAGDIGKGICVARRKGDTWFIGSAAGLEAWSDSLKLDFLKANKSYEATIYEDGDNGELLKKVVTIRKNDLLPISLKAKNGQAIILRMQ